MLVKTTRFQSFTFNFLTKGDGLNSCFGVQIKECDVLLNMCNEIVFSITKSLGFL